MYPIYAILGVALVLMAILFGLMLAPLVVGAILIYIPLKRADRALQQQAPGAMA